MSPRAAKSGLVEHAFALSVEELVTAGLLTIDRTEPSPINALVLRPSVRVLRGTCLPLVVGGTLVALKFELEIGTTAGWGAGFTQNIQVDHDAKRQRAAGWAFRCPGVDMEGKPCNRPARVLYLPHGRTEFMCRKCHGLQYQSSRRSDKRLTPYFEDRERLATELVWALAQLQRGSMPTPQGRLALRAAGILASLDPEFQPFASFVPPTPSPEERAFAQEFNAGRPPVLMSPEEAAEFLERLESARSCKDGTPEV